MNAELTLLHAGLVVHAAAVGSLNSYAGTCTAVHDGDTVHVTVLDPLLSTPVILAVRVFGINAAELDEPGGPEGRDALTALLTPGRLVTLSLVRSDKYSGRVVASITTTNPVLNVAEWMVSQQLAVRWDGNGPKPTVPWPPASLS